MGKGIIAKGTIWGEFKGDGTVVSHDESAGHMTPLVYHWVKNIVKG